MDNNINITTISNQQICDENFGDKFHSSPSQTEENPIHTKLLHRS